MDDVKRILVIVVFVFIFVISLGFILWSSLPEPVFVSSCDPEPFYVGVTYCGESVKEAKLLIDRVKNYTNLFVIQSGPLQWQHEKMNQICDYIVESNLFFIVHFGKGENATTRPFLC